MVVVPLAVIVAAISTLASVAEGFGITASAAGAFCALVPVILMRVALKTRRYDICYALFCLLMTCVMMPVAFLANGGVHSGMPLFCLGSLLLCTFCTNRKLRYLVFFAGLMVNVIVIVASICNPELSFVVDEAFLPYDNTISFFVVALGMLFIVSMVLTEYGKLTFARVALDRHMDSALRDSLLARYQVMDDYHFEESKNVAVLFLDLCGFSENSAKMPAADVTEYLEVFFDIADKRIHEHHGVLDKFMGDCVMAFWVEKAGYHDAASRACAAALDIRDDLMERADMIDARYGCDMMFSGGISYGEAVLGDVGSESRRDYTIIGDVVNVASRLEGLAQKGMILVSQSLARELHGTMNVKKYPEQIVLKGKGMLVTVFELMGAESGSQLAFDFSEEPLTGYRFLVCGCRGSHARLEPEYSYYGGDTSCYVLRKDDYALIIDCGTGMQRARRQLEGCTRIDVVLTHVFYDYLIGLLDWSVFPENAQLVFYGNFEKQLGGEMLSTLLSHPYWPVDLSDGDFISVHSGNTFELLPNLSVSFRFSDHPNSAFALKIDVEGKSIWMLSDNGGFPAIPDEDLADCDLLLFDDEEYIKETGTTQSNWRIGVNVAERVKPKRLVITRFVSGSTDKELRAAEDKAKKMYPATSFARAGDTFWI